MDLKLIVANSVIRKCKQIFEAKINPTVDIHS